MPNQPKTPSRNVRVPDDLWKAAQEKAAEQGETVADVIRRALEDYTRSGPRCTCAGTGLRTKLAALTGEMEHAPACECRAQDTVAQECRAEE